MLWRHFKRTSVNAPIQIKVKDNIFEKEVCLSTKITETSHHPYSTLENSENNEKITFNYCESH